MVDHYVKVTGKPRVVFLDHVAQLSGAELALLRLLPSMTEIDPFVLLAEPGPLTKRLEQVGIPHEVFPIEPRTGSLRRDRISRGMPLVSVFDTATYAARLAKRIRALQADLVHTNSLKANLYGGLAARMAGVPQVWHARDRVARDYLPLPAVQLTRAAARVLPKAVIGNSAATLATLSPAKGTPPGWTVISDPVLPAPVPGHRNSRFTVGLVGRLAPWKGQDLFLRAFAEAFPDSDERAVIVGSAMFGEDSYADSLPNLANQLGIGDRVEFAGFVDDVVGELGKLDVLVHCSTVPEPFGQVVLEGMAASLPVVAARAGGPAEIIDEGRTGLLTRLGDPHDLSRALRMLADDPELRARLGAAGREASQHYSPERLAGEVTDVYRAVLRDAARTKA